MSKELQREITKMMEQCVKTVEEKEAAGKKMLLTLNPGTVFNVGKHEFIVLEHNDGATKVISKNLMKTNIKFGPTTNYADSNVRKIIEETLLPEIADEIGEDNIFPSPAHLMTVDAQSPYAVVDCKMRPPTFDEVRTYKQLLVNKDIGDWWWTCTTWSTADRGWEYSVAVVSPQGSIDYCSFDRCNGVRPFCIFKSDLFVSVAKGETHE